MTASPSLSELPLAMLAPLPDEYAPKRGDLVRVPLQSWCCSFVEGRVRDVLWNGVVIVETAERARSRCARVMLRLSCAARRRNGE